jgi:ribonuclease HI
LEEKNKHHTKIYQKGRKSRLYLVIWNHQKFKKRVRQENTIFSAEKSAVLTAIHSTIKEPGRKLIATDSLSTLVATSGKKDTKNPKTRTKRKLLRQERDKITLLWIPSHVVIPGNEEADNAAREALNENLDRTYPPQDLANWITEQHEDQQQTQ